MEDLCMYMGRQQQNVLTAERYITAELKRNSVPYITSKFIAETPLCTASLSVDSKSIECKGTSFVGGKIDSKSVVLSSTIPSRFNLENSNINFNPYSDAVSCVNFYFAPAIAISRRDVAKVLLGNKISGSVVVKRLRTPVSHILVGNVKNPENIVFAHYDSILTGALDNASGVAVSLFLVIQQRELLENTLFVFDPCEELSFDKPTYWGYGFRVFEKKFPKLMTGAKKIIPIDCVGNGPVTIDVNPSVLYLAFPIKNFEALKNKMITLYSSLSGLMRVYHSSLDKPSTIKEKYLREAAIKLTSLLKNV